MFILLPRAVVVLGSSLQCGHRGKGSRFFYSALSVDSRLGIEWSLFHCRLVTASELCFPFTDEKEVKYLSRVMQVRGLEGGQALKAIRGPSPPESRDENYSIDLKVKLIELTFNEKQWIASL